MKTTRQLSPATMQGESIGFPSVKVSNAATRLAVEKILSEKSINRQKTRFALILGSVADFASSKSVIKIASISIALLWLSIIVVTVFLA